MLIDPFGRSVTYLRISITDRCNLRCAYCLPASGIKWIPREDLLTADEIIYVVETAASLGVSKIRLTGGEPLIRPDLLEIVARISATPGIQDLSLTTNAILLEKMAQPLADAGLKRVNISLDTLDADKFQRVTRFGDFDCAWKGILAAEAAGLTPIKLNTVVVGGFNFNEISDIASLTKSYPWHIRFIELMPVGNQQEWGDNLPTGAERYVSVQKMHAQLEHLDLAPAEAPTGNGPARTFRIPGAIGTVGFISPLGEHFCENCNRLRLTADGYLRACLLMDKEISVREGLSNGANLKALLQQSVDQKPKGHELASSNYPEARRMAQIGG
ncbi:MAG: GTP 3',8-cyclase MoaA [Anaerolineae bacterium]|jgi:cyclic pyranopterin phosphate synthase|nr:GTP 3',8-cyclase MoaA [Anaerolineae bacterium]MBT6322300.1 GTP 3',8-cyclase MoaA [Anaerolineae bacterium]MBT7018158.1 GTP 3',8-cyclase MoaA [Anaerolineae bacterium]MBT7602211.1 GTP 3',8-cyclase MoaA [Anaerolineae bacterium]MBT7776095.1 GTP 3',8-cyclase MoaA [Anaerolineae bacterium]